MKKMFLLAAIIGLTAFVGCKTIPETGTMYTTGYAIGVATGLVTNQTKIDDASRNAVIEIMNKVSTCIPETNQTFEAAWTDIAQTHTQELIDKGTLTPKQGELVMSAFSLVVKGIDYIFEERYPEAKVYKDLTTAATHGFINGFLFSFKPANSTSVSRAAFEYDEEAYEWLLRETQTRTIGVN